VNVLSDGTATVQVFSGPVLFIDPVTNNTITVGTDQMLMLPVVQPSGFTTQDLQNDVSTFTPGSVNQWWTQTISPSNSILNQPVILVVFVIVIAVGIVIPLVAVNKRRRQGHSQSSEQNGKFKKSGKNLNG
jgi:hypothetical protein